MTTGSRLRLFSFYYIFSWLPWFFGYRKDNCHNINHFPGSHSMASGNHIGYRWLPPQVR